MHLHDDKVHGLDFKKNRFKELNQIIAIGNDLNLGKPLVLKISFFHTNDKI